MRVRTKEYTEWARKYAAEYRARNPQLHRDRVKRSRVKALAADPDHHKKKDLKRFYGVSFEWYLDTLESQNYSCAICGKHESQNTMRAGKPMKMSVDHCHKTFCIRGLLCNNCNRAIGMLDHSPAVLSAAIKYLAKHGVLT